MYEFLQVSAVRADGRRQKISYSLEAGNEDNKFSINPSTGTITVDNWESLDYETTPSIKLIVVAMAQVSSENSVYGYCEVLVQLLDENDNSPKFTQDLYYSSVWEGNNKGNFVMQVHILFLTLSIYLVFYHFLLYRRFAETRIVFLWLANLVKRVWFRLFLVKGRTSVTRRLTLSPFIKKDAGWIEGLFCIKRSL